MGLLRRAAEKRLSKAFRSDPAGKAMADAIEGWGIYDYSSESRAKADRAYTIISNAIGDDPLARPFYEQVLKTSSLPISLCSIYTFVVTRYIQTGFWDPDQLRLKQAQDNAMFMGAFFPQYKQWVANHHTGAEQMAVLAISSNFIEYFLQ